MGGNLGRDKIYALMKNGDIPDAWWMGNKLVAEKKNVDLLIERMKNRPIQNGIIETTPMKYLHEIVQQTAG